MDRSKIEWTDATWNPLRGCTRVSPGCGGPGPHGGCYAEAIAARFSDPGQPFHGIAERTAKGGRWTGKVALAEQMLDLPLRWRKPRRIFVNSMSDLFHEKVPDEWVDRIFAVMALCPQHTFQVLTKRPERMRDYLRHRWADEAPPQWSDAAYWRVITAARVIDPDAYESSSIGGCTWWPLPNVWLGTSVENQEWADERISQLLATPAAVRFLSCEPLLGPVDLRRTANSVDDFKDCGGHPDDRFPQDTSDVTFLDGLTGRWDCEMQHPSGYVYADRESGTDPGLRDYERGIDWVIAGGESGPTARPMHPAWARGLRDQCAEAGVPFFFKQWGEWAPGENCDGPLRRTERTADWFDGRWSFGTMTPSEATGLHTDDEPTLYRCGKGKAGRLLDGAEHNGMPEVAHV